MQLQPRKPVAKPTRQPAVVLKKSQRVPQDVFKRLEGTRCIVNHQLSLGASRKALAIAHQALDEVQSAASLSEEYASKWYSALIRDFLRNRSWIGANSLYTRMKQEKIPASAKVVEKLLLRSRNNPCKLDAVDQIIRDASKVLKDLKEEHLVAILTHLNRRAADLETMHQILRDFAQKQPTGWRPSPDVCAQFVKANSRSRIWRAADWWVKSGMEVATTLLGNERKGAIQGIYESWFEGSVPKPVNTRTRTKLKQLRAMKVNPTRSIYNLFIEDAGRRGRADKALHYYRAMRRQSKTKPISDSRTYSLMFKALSASSFRRNIARYPRRHLLKVPALGTVHPRQGRRLFHDMTTQHMVDTGNKPRLQTSFHLFNTYTLNTALRYFLSKRDYAAATVTAHSFPICSVPTSQNTFRHVWTALMNRIKSEILAGHSVSTWADKMVGERVWDALGRVWDNSIGQLLMDSAYKETLERLDQRKRELRAKGDQTVVTYSDLRLILTLLRRALLADLAHAPGQQFSAAEDQVYRDVMARAHHDMLPQKLRCIDI